MSLNFIGYPIGSALAGPIVDRSVMLALLFGALLSVFAGAVTFAVIPPQGRGQPDVQDKAQEEAASQPAQALNR